MTEIQADLLLEHVSGTTIRQIAKRRGLSRSAVGRIVRREGDRLIGELENDLRVAQDREANGQEGFWPTCAVPPQIDADRRAALALFFWGRDQLADRGWNVETITRYVDVRMHDPDTDEMTTGQAVVFMLMILREE